MTPTMSSSLCTFAALAGAGGRPGRRASQKGGNKRAVAQPLAAGAVTEAPPAVISPPARPVVTTPRRREGRTGDAGTDQLVAWKSIRQERWEGALEVEGELPLWLVGDLSPIIICTNMPILCLHFVLFPAKDSSFHSSTDVLTSNIVYCLEVVQAKVSRAFSLQECESIPLLRFKTSPQSAASIYFFNDKSIHIFLFSS
jgi:hypothetical protein